MAGATQSSQEFSGKSVEEATAEGLRRLGLRADEAVVEVISRGSRGLFGIGSEPAVVRISRAPEGPSAPEPATALPPSPLAEPRAEATADTGPAQAAAQPQPISQLEPAAKTEPATPTEAVSQSETGTQAAADHDDEIIALASEMLATLVQLMGFDAHVQAAWRDADAITDERHLLLSVHGDDLSPLIGRRGDTLENLQYLLRLMVNQKLHRWLNIIVDVEDFRAKRVDHLTHLAERMAEQVAGTGRSLALEPMPPNERRIIHLALRNHDAVYTESSGDGERRKVIIIPKK